MTNDDTRGNEDYPTTDEDSTPIAADLREFADEVARLERQAETEDIRVRYDSSTPMHRDIRLDYSDDYDVAEDPDGLTKPEVAPDGGSA